MSQCALVVFKLPSRMVAIFPQTTSCTDLGDIVIFVCVWLLSSRPIFGGIDCLRHTNNTHYYCNRPLYFFSLSFSLSSFLFQTMSISMYFGVSWLDPRIKINDTATEWREVKTGPKDVSAINYRWQAKTLALDRHQLSLKYSGNGLPDFFFRK